MKVISCFERNGIVFRLTVRPTSRAGTQVGHSDPVILSGKVIDQRIKGTLGITGLYLCRVPIDAVVWHLDVGSSRPGWLKEVPMVRLFAY